MEEILRILRDSLPQIIGGLVVLIIASLSGWVYYKLLQKQPPRSLQKSKLNQAPSSLAIKLSDLPYPFIDTSRKLDVVVILGDDMTLTLKDSKSMWEEIQSKAHVTDGIVGAFISFWLARNARNKCPEIIIADWLDRGRYSRSKAEHNLIVIGSPQVNHVMRRINEQDFNILPVRFEEPYEPRVNVMITRTGRRYSREEQIGFIALTRNPYSADKYVMIVAGASGAGTWAAGYALAFKTKEIRKIKRDYVIVKAIDSDKDGVYDDAEIISEVNS